MEMLVRDRIVSADVVESRNAGFTAQLVDELALPKQHDVLLVLRCFLNLGRVELSSLLLLDFEDLTEGAATKFLHDFEATL